MKYTLTYNKRGQVITRNYATLSKLARHYRMVRRSTMADWKVAA